MENQQFNPDSNEFLDYKKHGNPYIELGKVYNHRQGRIRPYTKRGKVRTSSWDNLKIIHNVIKTD